MDYVVRVSGSTKIQPKVINIDGSDDSFYRYKMRQLFVQVVGKGKMIKTNLLNVDDVSRDLKIPPAFYTAYLGYEIGTPSKFDPKKPERERGSISGDYDAKLLSSVAKKMIDEWILCPKCKYPECTMVVDPKSKKIQLECRSCGASSVPALNDKFTKFVLNNESRLKEIKQQMEKVIPKAMAKKSSKSRSSEKDSAPGENGEGNHEDEDEEWAVSLTADAVKERQRNLADKFADGQLQENAVKDLAPTLSAFASSHSEPELVEELKSLQKEYKLENSSCIKLLFPLVVSPGSELKTIFEEKKELLKPFLGDTAAQIVFIEALEGFASDDENLSSYLKKFYDIEVLEEESVLEWHESNLKSEGSKFRAQKFVDWLKTAEEESEGDEE